MDEDRAKPTTTGTGVGTGTAERPAASVPETPVAPLAEASATPAVSEPAVAEPPVEPVVAPPWTGKVYYLVGGVLPKTYLPWVWHDLHDAGWRRRQAARPGLLMLPFALVFALLPGQVGVRVTVVAFLLVASVGLGIGTSNYFRNRRLVQHGFAPVKSVYTDEDFDE